MDLERRTAVEWRISGRRLEGTVVRFGAEADLGAFRERVVRGAFDRSLASGQDIRALVDHDPSSLLARTSSGTLRLRTDDAGLHFALDVPDTTLGRDVLVLAERRDLSGMSFGFRVPPGGETRVGAVRELRSVDLREITVVTGHEPAYPDTSITARMQDADTRARLAVMARYLRTL